MARMIAMIVNQSGAPLSMREDLTQEAWKGVVESIRNYDPARGVPFPAFARRRAHGAVLDAMRRDDPLSRRQRLQAKEGRFTDPKFYPVDNATTVAAAEMSPELQAMCAEVPGWLKFLDAAQRHVITELFWHGKGPAETGKGIGVKASRTHQIRKEALRAIRYRLGMLKSRWSN
jgi:RNA polymerase sigma factor (sigma-70 family)